MNQYFNTPLSRFRTIALLEGISFLVLLGIAMPLKHFANMPEVVKYCGWMHGILFILYIVFLNRVQDKLNWPLKKTAIAFIASLLPFGTFILDHKWLKQLADTN